MIEILILSLIQGITEFLPISSSSHLILMSEYLAFKEKIILEHEHMNFDTKSLPRKKSKWVWGLNLYQFKGSL